MSSAVTPIFMLFVVLAAIPLVLWTLKKIQTFRPAGALRTMEVTSQLALGARERIVVVRIHERVLVLGVTPQQVTLLTESNVADLPPDVPANVQSGMHATQPSFGDLVRKAAGLQPNKRP